MKIGKNLEIVLHNDSTLSITFGGDTDHKSFIISRMDKTYPQYDNTVAIYNFLKPRSDALRDRFMTEILTNNTYPDVFPVRDSNPLETTAEAVPEKELTSDEKLIRGIGNLMNFFSEFAFEPSFRFTNTLAYKAQKSCKAVKDYIGRYFSLMDSSYKDEVKEKLKSKEFNNIVDDIKQYGSPKAVVNKRLKIYYGSAGTGKTTKAQNESENRCVVCNSSMLPSDLMEDFVFTDGNPDFKPSILWNCMEEGKPIVLDEINLLPFDSLRFLQGIVDGKSEFSYKNRPVHIHEGFQIIGTMNLTIGGMAYGLPEPLVDRCADIEEFKLTAEQLAKSICE